MDEKTFIRNMKAMINEVVLPAVDDKVKREVESVVKRIVYGEMRNEIMYEIKDLITEIFDKRVSIEVKLKP